MRLLCPLVMLTACSIPEPELPSPEPVVEPRPHRSIDELPGPHPMPVPAVAAEPDVDDWGLVDAGTIEPLSQDPCNPGLAPLYSALARRDATIAGQVRRATLGCLAANNVADARQLADALTSNDLEAIDNYVVAKVLLAQRASAGFSVCDDNAFLSDVLGHVADAADPVVSTRMLTDPDFSPIHRAFPYRRATIPGVDQDTTRLVGTVWHGAPVGAFGSLQRLELGAAGAAVLHTATVTENNELLWTEESGQWSMQDQDVSVSVGDAPAVVYQIRYPEGTLAKDPAPGIADFFPYAAECDA